MPDKISKIKIKEFLLGVNRPIIVEIGANDGRDTCEILEVLDRKDLKMYCFEPDPRAAKEFYKRIQDGRCTLIPQAICNHDGKMELHMSSGKANARSKENIQSSSIKKPKKHLQFFPWCKFEKTVEVMTLKLDTWIEVEGIDRVDFIWADVQGAEEDLILGGLETLNKKTKYFYTEFYDVEMYEGQPNLKKIKELLPRFEQIGKYGNNVLLRNRDI